MAHRKDPLWLLVAILGLGGCGSGGGLRDGESIGGIGDGGLDGALAEPADGDATTAVLPDGSTGTAADARVPGDSAVVAPAHLVLDRTAADFGVAVSNDMCGLGTSIGFRVTNTGDEASSELSGEIVGMGFKISADGCTGARLAAHGFCDVVVRAQPTVPLGTQTAALRVSSLAGDEVTATLTTQVVQGGDFLEVTPSPLDVGDVVVGQRSAVKTLTLRNVGGQPAIVSAVTLASTEFEISKDGCTGVSIPPNGTCSVEVALHPQTAGVKSAVLVMGAIGCSTGQAVVTITGTAREARLAVDHGDVDFGYSPQCSKYVQKTITVTNDGDAPSGALTVASTNPAFAIVADDCTGKSLAVAASCSVTLELRGTLVEIEMGQLTVTAAGGPMVSAALHGGVIQVETDLSLYPTDMPASALFDFGSIAVGGMSAPASFTVRNGCGDIGPITVALAGVDASSFVIDSTTCGDHLAAYAACQVLVSFRPKSVANVKVAVITVTAAGGTSSVVLNGRATP